jgi:hypothetical protein
MLLQSDRTLVSGCLDPLYKNYNAHTALMEEHVRAAFYSSRAFQ